ncbi:MAG: prenyltransferase/squalene oxidase repeat-containing protein [Ferrimicrobium sp.]
MSNELLNKSERYATASWLVSIQHDNGMIAWTPSHHADPWNHSEAVLALLLEGEVLAARAGIDWLGSVVNRDGSLFQYYQRNGVKEPRIDLNSCLYPAVAIAGYLRATDYAYDTDQILGWFDRTTAFVLAHQRSDGSFPWALGADRRPLSGSLVAASSAMVLSLEAIRLIDEDLGRVRPEVVGAESGLREWLAGPMPGVIDKGEWAMDWYYPVLAGVVSRSRVDELLGHLFSIHGVDGEGIRAVASAPWVTTAETAETAMALVRLGRGADARKLLGGTRALRRNDGSYLTGWVLPGRTSFPDQECSTYSAAAVLIAHHLVELDRAATLIDLVRGASDAEVVVFPSVVPPATPFGTRA